MGPENFYGDDSGFERVIADVREDYAPSRSPGYLVLKRLFDVAASLFGLLLILPLIPFIVLLIKLETRGPILFKQVRVGYRGRQFHCSHHHPCGCERGETGSQEWKHYRSEQCLPRGWRPDAHR